MADDRNDITTPTTRAQLEQLLDAMRSSSIADDVRYRGIDMRALQETIRALLDARVASFLTRDQIEVLIERGINERLGRIGLRMDEDHIEETGDAIRGAMKWHRLASRTLMGAAGTILLGAVYALARKLGLPVPSASS